VLFRSILVEVVAEAGELLCEVGVSRLVLVDEALRGLVLGRQTDEPDAATGRRLGGAVLSAHCDWVGREASQLFAVLHLLRLQRLLDLAVSYNGKQFRFMEQRDRDGNELVIVKLSHLRL